MHSKKNWLLFFVQWLWRFMDPIDWCYLLCFTCFMRYGTLNRTAWATIPVIRRFCVRAELCIQGQRCHIKFTQTRVDLCQNYIEGIYQQKFGAGKVVKFNVSSGKQQSIVLSKSVVIINSTALSKLSLWSRCINSKVLTTVLWQGRIRVHSDRPRWFFQPLQTLMSPFSTTKRQSF